MPTTIRTKVTAESIQEPLAISYSPLEEQSSKLLYKDK